MGFDPVLSSPAPGLAPESKATIHVKKYKYLGIPPRS